MALRTQQARKFVLAPFLPAFLSRRSSPAQYFFLFLFIFTCLAFIRTETGAISKRRCFHGNAAVTAAAAR
jgi:hypothetical protein